MFNCLISWKNKLVPKEESWELHHQGAFLQIIGRFYCPELWGNSSPAILMEAVKSSEYKQLLVLILHQVDLIRDTRQLIKWVDCEATQMPEAFIHSHSAGLNSPTCLGSPCMRGSTSSIWSDMKRKNRTLKRIGEAKRRWGRIDFNSRGPDSSAESWCWLIFTHQITRVLFI